MRFFDGASRGAGAPQVPHKSPGRHDLFRVGPRTLNRFGPAAGNPKGASLVVCQCVLSTKPAKS
eukprot:14215706-Alexandrium_andersonii.AAC.1